MNDLLVLAACVTLPLWLWGRARKYQLNVFSHRIVWLLALAAVASALLGGTGDEWHHRGKAYMEDMDALQWLVLAITVVVPCGIAVRALGKGGNVFSASGVKALALGLVAWAALGYLSRDLYYGCNPLSPFCRSTSFNYIR